MIGGVLQSGGEPSVVSLIMPLVMLTIMAVVMVVLVGIVSGDKPLSPLRKVAKRLVEFAKGHYLLDLLVLVVLAVALWFFRPLVKGTIMMWYTTPSLFTGAILGIVLSLIVFKLLDGKVSRPALTSVATVIIIAAIVLSLVSASLYSPHTLGQNTMDTSEDRAGLPQVDSDHPRILTRAAANRYASNSLQTSKFKATGSDITVYNGSMHWSYALAPDGFRNVLMEQQNGTVLVNMETQGKDVSVINQDMQVGQGMAVFDNYRWRLVADSEYLVDYQDAFMVVQNDSQYMAVPYTKPNHQFRATPFPTAYTTPEWGGVALIHQNGTIEDLSPSEAQEHPVLEDQRLVPFDLVREKVSSTSYRNGIMNVLPVVGSHHEQIEVAPVPGSGNDQPFFVHSTEGLKYITAVEPYGDTQGVREVWVTDARAEDYEVYRAPDGSTLLGPRKAADYVRQAARQTDWDRFSPAEPIPVVVNDTLYWELRVVPNDASGISYVAFVNAETSDVVGVEETEEVRAFIEGDSGSIDDVAGNESTDGRTPTMIVEKVNANGDTVATMQVYDNESVVIDHNASG